MVVTTPSLVVEKNLRDSLFLLDIKNDSEELQNDPCFHVFSFGRRRLHRFSATLVDFEDDLLHLQHPGEMPFQFQPKSLWLAL